MSLQKGENKGNIKQYYEIQICFNCLKTVNLRHVISSKFQDNYRYIICDCGQMMKVVKTNNEENLVRIKRNGKEVKEAYKLFFEREYSDEIYKDINEQKKTVIEFMREKKQQIELRKKEKKKSKLKVVR